MLKFEKADASIGMCTGQRVLLLHAADIIIHVEPLSARATVDHLSLGALQLQPAR